MHARQVVEPAFHSRHDPRHSRKRLQPRSVTADDGVLADEAVAPLDIRQHDSHDYAPPRPDTGSANTADTCAGARRKTLVGARPEPLANAGRDRPLSQDWNGQT